MSRAGNVTLITGVTGPLESTNRSYAIAKIAGIEMCHAYNGHCGTRYMVAMPTNLYGQNDNSDLSSYHALPALIRKMHEGRQRNAGEVVVWGAGMPTRDFLYSDDMAEMIKRGMGYTGELKSDTSKPDRAMRKLMNVSRLTRMGWCVKTGPEQELRQVYCAYTNEAA